MASYLKNSTWVTFGSEPKGSNSCPVGLPGCIKAQLVLSLPLWDVLLVLKEERGLLPSANMVRGSSACSFPRNTPLQGWTSAGHSKATEMVSDAQEQDFPFVLLATCQRSSRQQLKFKVLAHQEEAL